MGYPIAAYSGTTSTLDRAFHAAAQGPRNTSARGRTVLGRLLELKHERWGEQDRQDRRIDGTEGAAGVAQGRLL